MMTNSVRTMTLFVEGATGAPGVGVAVTNTLVLNVVRPNDNPANFSMDPAEATALMQAVEDAVSQALRPFTGRMTMTSMGNFR